MTTFVDTSALLAVLDADDQNHGTARRIWERLIEAAEDLVSTNYVLVETYALTQNRLGVEAVRTLHEDVVPVLWIEWMDAQTHASSVEALLAAARRQLSLADCSSFDTMRRRGITAAFAFDRHFAEQGFTLIS